MPPPTNYMYSLPTRDVRIVVAGLRQCVHARDRCAPIVRSHTTNRVAASAGRGYVVLFRTVGVCATNKLT